MVAIAGSGDPSMPKFQRIDDGFREFIEAQKVFFVATAAPEGRVNVAAKGMDTLRVVGPNRIVWLNLTGSENETAAHLVESPRMTLMWCSFEARTLVLRAYGRAKVFHPRANEWQELISLFPPLPGARQILALDVDLVMTSCGFGVPLFDYVGQRETLQRWGEKKGPEGVHEFWEKRNQLSIDDRPTRIFADPD
jgi:Pyridoxamine 5'-phosphate oxidase